MNSEITAQKNYRPLVVRLGALGDMVMLTPLLRRLYERTGQTVDLVVSGKWNSVLFANCPWINEIHYVDSRNAPYWLNKSKRELVSKLRKSDSNRVWFMLEHLEGLYRLMDRSEFARANGITTQIFPRQTGEHTCEQFSRMVNSPHKNLPDAPKTTDSIIPELHLSETQIQECKDWLLKKSIDYTKDKIILIQAGNKKTMRSGWLRRKRDRDSNIKYWPEKNWAALIEKISADAPNTKILLCGAPSEKDLCNDILALCPNNPSVMQVADDLPLGRLMALASLAHSCISVDTGPAHIAAALGCPLVVLFGKSDARQFRPLGKNAVEVVAQENWKTFKGDAQDWAKKNSMLGISVDQVFEAWSNISR